MPKINRRTTKRKAPAQETGIFERIPERNMRATKDIMSTRILPNFWSMDRRKNRLTRLAE
jgi:hypothetical protein